MTRTARRLGAALALLMLVTVASSWAAAAPAKKKSTKSTAKRDTVLVRIGKDVIKRADVEARIQSLPDQFRSNYSTPEGRQQLLDRMIEERVWLSQASKSGIPERPQIKQQIEQQRRDLLIRTYLNEMMAKNPAVSDSEARVYYDAHLQEYRVPATISARHIQCKSESEGKKVKQWAKSGQDWVMLTKRFSTDTLTKATGGNLGTITRDGAFGSLGMQPALADSAFSLAEGKIGGPWKSAKGWHVIRVDQSKPESVRPFDQVKSMISRQLASQRQQDFYKAQLDSARRSLKVTPDSTAIKNFLAQRRTAREMFNDAQALGPPKQRIDAYQKLLAEYPNSEVSPQAQFMIGFIYSEELKSYDEAEKAFRAVLQHYPKAELAPSAQWMIEHMRTEEAPAFINSETDSGTNPAPAGNKAPGAPAASGAGSKSPAKSAPKTERSYRP